MCYYNGQKVTRAEYIRLKQLEKLTADYDFLTVPVHDGFDFGFSAVLKRKEGLEDFDLVKMEWGFVPSHLPNREAVWKFRNDYVDANGVFHKGFTTLNAKGENLFLNEQGKPSMFRFSALERRCLILSTGFYESRHIYHRNKKTGALRKTPERYPYRIHLPGQDYFYLAGIWNPWTAKDGSGEYVETFAIITTEANQLMAKVHNSKKRMPTILDEDLAYEWLFGNLDEKRIAEIALTQCPSDKMAAYPIERNYKNALNPTAAFHYADLPDLDAPEGGDAITMVQNTLF
jgi:putative SOS response-associated peptidase YedK